jgi:hypothetical protein
MKENGLCTQYLAQGQALAGRLAGRQARRCMDWTIDCLSLSLVVYLRAIMEILQVEEKRQLFVRTNWW